MTTDLTTSEANAVAMAGEYLDYAAFSQQGLVAQLVYSGFDEQDARFAAIYINVDWTIQACRKAVEYLSVTAFAHRGLADQLMSDGFTEAQALAGAASQFPEISNSGPESHHGVTRSQANAVARAWEYLNSMAFSRAGLIEQLGYDGFDQPDATYAVDHINVDWTEQAGGKATEYLATMPFSRRGLVEQLIFDGFTRAQAEAGVASRY